MGAIPLMIVDSQRLARFQVESLLSEGSLGPVYLARDLTLDRPIALLVVPRAIALRPGFREPFLTAIKAAAGLHHPSIAELYEIAEHDGEFYLSAEYVPGLNLDNYLRRSAARRQAIKLDEAIFLIEQAADALAYAHAVGVAHGDIKLERLYVNRLPHPVRRGEPPLRAKITGFGLAAVQQATMSAERTMSDASTSVALEDVQSLATMFYQLVMGSPAAAQDSEHPVVEPSPPTNLPAAVAGILERTLAARPELRFQTADELRESLAEASQLLTEGRPGGPAPVVSGVSLIPSSVVVAPAAEPALQAANSGNAPLLIASYLGQEYASFRLDQPMFTIGRAKDNDIVLPDGGVSRHHLRLLEAEGQWLVVDLASTNSTLLEGEPVGVDTPRVWRTGETLRVGPYTIRRLPATMELHSSSFAPITEPAAGESSRLSIEPDSARIQPGELAHFTLRVFNGHPAVRRVRLAVDGIPEPWLKNDGDPVTLPPRSEGAVPLVISPPRESGSTSGRWPFVVRAILENGESERLSLPATITLLPFVHYAGSLQPQVLRGCRTCRLLLHNSGNTTTTFNVHASAQDNTLDIVAAPPAIRLAPGENGESDLTLEIGRRPFWGSAALVRFQVEVTSAGGRTLSLPGRFLLKPVITPRRLLVAAAVLLLLTLLAIAYVSLPA